MSHCVMDSLGPKVASAFETDAAITSMSAPMLASDALQQSRIARICTLLDLSFWWTLHGGP
jgi:hypothetical protein